MKTREELLFKTLEDRISHLADCVDQILRCLQGKDVMEEHQVCYI